MSQRMVNWMDGCANRLLDKCGPLVGDPKDLEFHRELARRNFLREVVIGHHNHMRGA